jgi:hypothetical protein
MTCSQCTDEYCKCVKNHEYFLATYSAFRKIMCSKEYSPCRKNEAYEYLLYVYIMTEHDDDTNQKIRVRIITMVNEEFSRRMSHELFMFKG